MDREANRPSGGVSSTQPIELVREGMQVVDATGRKVGKVEFVKMGDPEAVTTQGQEADAGGLIGAAGRAFWPEETEPDLPEPARAQLARQGFIKVDGPGLLDADRYVRADWIDAVTDDTVRLRASRDRLPRED